MQSAFPPWLLVLDKLRTFSELDPETVGVLALYAGSAGRSKNSAVSADGGDRAVRSRSEGLGRAGRTQGIHLPENPGWFSGVSVSRTIPPHARTLDVLHWDRIGA
jgi:hypothetical protein